MTDEEMRRYVEIGLRADIDAKAQQVQAAMKHLENMFHRASGMYVTSRFSESAGGLVNAINEFMEAMAKKEEYAGVAQDRRGGPEDGGEVPVGDGGDDAA